MCIVPYTELGLNILVDQNCYYYCCCFNYSQRALLMRRILLNLTMLSRGVFKIDILKMQENW